MSGLGRDSTFSCRRRATHCETSVARDHGRTTAPAGGAVALVSWWAGAPSRGAGSSSPGRRSRPPTHERDGPAGWRGCPTVVARDRRFTMCGTPAARKGGVPAQPAHHIGAEVDAFLGRAPYERRVEDAPSGSRNGWQPAVAVKTTMGSIELKLRSSATPTRSSARSSSGSG